MDLGLKGKKAIVCAASKGLGKACAMSIAREGSKSSSPPAPRPIWKRRRLKSAATGSKVTAVPRRYHHRSWPRRRARRLPARTFW